MEGIIQLQTPVMGHLLLDQAAQSPLQPGPEHFQLWDIHSFSGQHLLASHYTHNKFISDI